MSWGSMLALGACVTVACGSGGAGRRDAAGTGPHDAAQGAGEAGAPVAGELDAQTGEAPPDGASDGEAPLVDASAPDGPTDGGDGDEAPEPPDSGADAGNTDDPRLRGSCQVGVEYDSPLPAADARQATPVAEGFNFVEGPVWVQDQGALYFSNMLGGVAGQILRFAPGMGVSELSPNAGSNGLALGPSDDLWAATQDAQTLSRFDPESGARTTLQLDYMGQRFNSPNDLVIRSDGTIYFTDPDWQLSGRESETGITGVYRVAPGGQVFLVDGSLDKPNGITLSLDETTLYVGSLQPGVLAYPVSPDGSTGSGEPFAATEGGTDGMTLDCAGNLYVTSASVMVFDPDGELLGEISTPETPSNVAFGGADRRTLYITAGTRLYAIELNVPGVPY